MSAFTAAAMQRMFAFASGALLLGLALAGCEKQASGSSHDDSSKVTAASRAGSHAAEAGGADAPAADGDGAAGATPASDAAAGSGGSAGVSGTTSSIDAAGSGDVAGAGGATSSMDAAGRGDTAGTGGSGSAGASGNDGTVAGAAGSGGAEESAAGSGGFGGSPAKATGVPDMLLSAGKPVQLVLPKDTATELSSLSEQVASLKELTTSQLLEKHKPGYAAAIDYDPSTAQGLELIQASALKLDDSELKTLRERGFVISKRQQFPQMSYGYTTIYSQDLPVYVSADSILDAVHRSFDGLLLDIEKHLLRADLAALLDAMRATLQASSGDSRARADADLYLAVAKSMLETDIAPPVAGADASQITDLRSLALNTAGVRTIEIFGAKREVDFTQFSSRGHYTEWDEWRYLQALTWLGRMDLRLIETNSDGTQTFHREQLETAILLRQLLDANSLPHYQRIDATLETFFGKVDGMQPSDIDKLLADLGVDDAQGLAALSDEQIATAIIAGGYGTQRIASQLIQRGSGAKEPLPLDRSFALFGQRYSVDSHVLSNVVYDRVPGRFMPNPLDVAYAALGNDQALQLLKPELETYAYAPQLEATRALIEAHDAGFWGSSLSTIWLDSLRALSPTAELADPKAAGLPTVVATEAWGRRLLDTQLASWAELRQDSPQSKTSYSSFAQCVFPDAYVDPYPSFYAALVRFAERGAALADLLANSNAPDTAQQVRLFFDHMRYSMSMLRDMAIAQRNGADFTAEQMAFINNAVTEHSKEFCTSPSTYTGWYGELIYPPLPNGLSGSMQKPTIADVHTQPTDAEGKPVGRVLHVGTGDARLMVMTADTCTGVKAYTGLALSYYEQVTDNWKRLRGYEWRQLVSDKEHPLQDVPWMKDIVAGGP